MSDKRILAILIAVTVLAAGTASAQTVLRIGLNDDPDALDPTISRAYVGRLVFAALCDKLFDVTPDLKIVPQLATGYEWAANSRSVVIKLRPGVKFHDGEPLNGEAVRFNDHGRSYGNIDVRGYETSAYLPYHTDAGDLVGLLCLRRARAGGLSSIVSSVTVHNEILAHHPEYLGLLYNGFYYIRREAALTERGVSDRPIPVFGEKDGVVSCRYIRNQINAGAVKRGVALTAIERAALDYLDEQTRRPDLRLDMDLQPGDIQLINNYTILHSRTEFVDGPEPHEKRHMLRLWLKFPVVWPIAPGFPEHLGYKPDQDTPVMAEAEA